MLFWKSEIRRIFAKHYKKMCGIVNKAVYANNPEYELLPPMLLLSDIASIMLGVEFSSLHNDLLIECKEKWKTDISIFESRIELYKKFLKNKNIRYEWNNGCNDLPEDDFTLVCCYVLSDILFNPECADDYFNAPKAIYGLDYCFDFVKQIVLPLCDEMIQYATSIQQYLKKHKCY